jgi:hypothetical protein
MSVERKRLMSTVDRLRRRIGTSWSRTRVLPGAIEGFEGSPHPYEGLGGREGAPYGPARGTLPASTPFRP